MLSLWDDLHGSSSAIGPASPAQQFKELRRNSTREVLEAHAPPRGLPTEGGGLVLGLSFHSRLLSSSAS